VAVAVVAVADIRETAGVVVAVGVAGGVVVGSASLLVRFPRLLES
jgi:hypothetical protein